MPAVPKDRLTILAKERALVTDDLKLSLLHCIELARQPQLFAQLLERCAAAQALAQYQGDHWLVVSCS